MNQKVATQNFIIELTGDKYFNGFVVNALLKPIIGSEKKIAQKSQCGEREI